MGISRSQVSRYLTEAREVGIVQIRVVHPEDRVDTLAVELQQRFPRLRTAIVVSAFSQDEPVIRQMIGQAAASFLRQSVLPGECLCIGCGRTVRSTVEALKSHPIPNLSVVQAGGSLGHEALDLDFNELTRAAAEAFAARAFYVTAPAVLGSGSAARIGSANVTIRGSLDRARQANIYLVGVGSLDRDQLYARAGLISQTDISWL